MGNKNTNTNPESQNQKKPEIHDKHRESLKRNHLSTEVVPFPETIEVKEERLGEIEEYGYTKNITIIENGNLRGGAPGKIPGKKGQDRTPESTKQAVEAIYKKFKPQTVITFEIPSDDKGNSSNIETEKKTWQALGVEVIELPVEETNLELLFEGELKEKSLRALQALDRGKTFVHCTHGLHRARAFTEIWRATRGIDQRQALKDNKAYDTSESHKKCRADASNIIERILSEKSKLGEEPREQAEQAETIPREETAARIALIGDSIGKGISEAIKGISNRHNIVAVGGARLQEESKKYREISTSQLDQIDPKKTPYLVIQGGTNDLSNSSPEEVAERLKNLYQKAIKMGFEKVVIVTIPPHTKASYTQKVLDTNAILREMTKKGEIVIYDIYKDYVAKDPNLQGIRDNNVHPNNHGYEILGNLIVDNFTHRPATSGTYAGDIGRELAAKDAAEAVGAYIAESHPETPTTTKHQSQESQKLQKDLQAELEKLAQDEALRAKDEETLKTASIKDIRFNTALLNGDENKVQEEMRRRLSQYTTRQQDGGLKLDYLKFNNLSGLDHEMGVGLGDVMPPEYTRILVVTLDGRYRFGTRAVTIHKGIERVGYNDEATGSYLATHSGDTVYILDPPLTDKTKLDELLEQEKQTRIKGKANYDSVDYSQSASGKSVDYGSILSSKDSTPLSEDQSGQVRENLRENGSLKDLAISKMDKSIQGEKFWNYDELEIKDPATGVLIWKYNKEASEGTNIYDFSVAVCRYYKMEDMIPVIWGMVGAESTFNPFEKNKGSVATGLGQPMHSTWSKFIPRAKSSRDPFASRIMAGQYGVGFEYPDSEGKRRVNLSEYRFPPEQDYLNYSRCNPFLNIYFTVLNTKKSIETYKSIGIDIRQLEVKEQLRLLYTMHHDGHGGGPAMIRFLKRLESHGIDTKDRDAVSAFMKSGSQEADEALSMLCGSRTGRDENGGRTSSQEHRARTKTDRFLNTWYETGQKAAKYAMMGSGIKEEPRQQRPQAMPALSQGTLIERAKAAAEASSFEYDCVYVLGCGNGSTNEARAFLGTKLAGTKGAFLGFSGGYTGDRKISEGQEALNAAKNNPEINEDLYKTSGIGIEDQSTNTNGNIDHFIEFAKRKGFKKILIVTTDSGKNFRGSRASQAQGAVNRLKRAYPEAQVSFYTPERPDIDRNLT